MATVKEVYELIKANKEAGEKIGPLQQAILDAYEKPDQPSTKEVDATFVKNKNEKDS